MRPRLRGPARDRAHADEGGRDAASRRWRGRSIPGRATYDDAYERLVWTAHHWQHWLDHGDFPDHPWRTLPAAQRADAQGPHLRADRRDRRRRDDVAARDARRRAQLGLPLHAGSATRRSCSGASTRSASTGRRTTSSTSSPTSPKASATCRSCTASTARRELAERTLDHLTGYEGARPVRVGNAAYEQDQHDVWGAVLDSVYLHTKSRDQLPERIWPILERRSRRRSSTGASPTAASGRCAASRSTSRRRSSCAGSPPTAARASPRSARTWRRSALAGRRRRDPRRHLRERASTSAACSRQHYDTDALDASVLLMPLVRFLPADDPRIRSTVLAIADELTEDGLVLRYRVEETDDGLAGEEGTFTICSFWLVSALVRDRRARSGRASCARSCCPTRARSTSTPRRSTRAPAATSATSRRRSRTWR